MPKAKKFTALGKGNGFNRCLTTTTVSGDQIINPPTFEQVVGSYWNFHSASFSGAEFEPGNEPMDIICTPSAATGLDIDSSIGPPSESFSVSNGSPGIVRVDGGDEIYYEHGILFRYITYEPIDNGLKLTSVSYTSTVASTTVVDPVPYSCIVLRATTYGESGSYSIGKLATQTKVDVTSFDIGGLPFVKAVVQEFSQTTYDDPVGSGNAVCATASFLPETSEVPSLTLWDY